MKGQYFILGSIVLIVVLFAGVALTDPLIRTPTRDMDYLSGNMQKEFPRALNFGIRSGTGASTLANFTRFTERVMAEQYVGMEALWIVAEGNGSSTLNITAGNFLGRGVVVTLNLSGTAQNLTVPDNSTNSTLFFSVPAQYSMAASFESESETVTWKRDKSSLLVHMELARGDDLVKEAFTA